MKVIKQHTIISDHFQTFDDLCNEFRSKNKCIATQTNFQITKTETPIYVAVIFYEEMADE